MRNALVAFWLLAALGMAHAAGSAETSTIAVGPWQVEASFTDERKFDRCVMTRAANDGIEATFTRDDAGLSLMLTSPRWQLEKGVNYPVGTRGGEGVLESRCRGGERQRCGSRSAISTSTTR